MGTRLSRARAGLRAVCPPWFDGRSIPTIRLEVLFNALPFLIFFPTFLTLYFLFRGRKRLWLCLAGSYLFYGYWDYRFLALIAFSTLVDYFLGLRLGAEERPEQRKRLVLASVAVNLGVLGIFKYYDFFVQSFTEALHGVGVPWTISGLDLILPVGISFYTFQTMSYSIDLYRKKIPVEKNFLVFAVYVAFFPQLVAGPIVRASTFLSQLHVDHRLQWDRLVKGFHIALWGYFLKVVIADSLAPIVDDVFGNPQAHTSISLLVGVVLYSFQIYGDFAGYSSIAIGIAYMMGYDFPQNFNRPYFSESFSEFWTRWHISLSSWLRDYLYISLGGNRKGKRRTQFNLFATMLLGGLWHGANYTFIFWGFLHGLYLVLQRLLGPGYHRVVAALRLPKIASKVFLIVLVWWLTNLAWIFFRCQSIGDAFLMIERIVAFDNMSPSSVRNQFQVIKCLGLVSLLFSIEWLSFKYDVAEILTKRPSLGFFVPVAIFMAIALFGTFGGTAFIYFQF